MKLQEFQKGNNSKMTSLQRLNAHNEWLEQMHKEIKDKLLTKNLIQLEDNRQNVIGFIKD
jgi:hypothetical protein